MGKSAKHTRGGNKHRVNVGRQKAKLAAAGVKDHTAYDQAANAAAAAHKAAAQAMQEGKAVAAARHQVKERLAESLRSLQQKRLDSGPVGKGTTAVKMAARTAQRSTKPLAEPATTAPAPNSM